MGEGDARDRGVTTEEASAAGKHPCAEHGKWTPVPVPAQAPADTSLELSKIDPGEGGKIPSAGAMSFHMTGCSGSHPADAAAAVADAMSGQDSSFLYHLGDITYVRSNDEDQVDLYNKQFLASYTEYPRQIVAIAGNHDGKTDSSAVQTFAANFCADPAKWPAKWSGNTTDGRPAMIQPYLYWRFDTPLAYFIGLYANISNGGILDDPKKYPLFTDGPQYNWLVSQLEDVKSRNANLAPASRPAIFVTVHYPPYSGATNFNIRGAPKYGRTPQQENAPHLAESLQQAFAKSGQRPDAIFSAHAHLFQRLTYTYADGTVMPCLIVGNGGHSLENLLEKCDPPKPPPKPQPQSVPFPAIAPKSFKLPAHDSASVEAYEDGYYEVFPGTTRSGGAYGFIHVTVENRVLTCSYWNAPAKAADPPRRGDSFSLNLDTHRYV
jgi:hypothetical protein